MSMKVNMLAKVIMVAIEQMKNLMISALAKYGSTGR
jgi:hypothetical protein